MTWGSRIFPSLAIPYSLVRSRQTYVGSNLPSAWRGAEVRDGVGRLMR